MPRAVLLSIGVAAAVAGASRFAEWLCRMIVGSPTDLLPDLVGMSVAALTAGLLFFLWRYQHRERVRLLRERERAMRHIHHHIRNSLQVIANLHPDDPLVRKHIAHMLRELEYALPGSGKHMPEQADSSLQRIS